ncbi:MAG: MGH1-like glycoside hydrolase domain-containing protein [Rhodospirillales bacterium]
MPPAQPAEFARLAEDARRTKNWKRWGPYLAERQWGTVREDYSPNGDVWHSFPHDHARSRAYRWGEDGLLGITDRECRLCFALALWNERDHILKERLFGLTNPEGNHGEDVKECYFYLDSTPTHSYMKALYKYPQAEFPYKRLLEENRRRTRHDPEFELEDTGIFESNRYFDVFAEYAKAAPNDILIRVTVVNRGPEAAPLHVLPVLWFRNTWTWGPSYESGWGKPAIVRTGPESLKARHASLGTFHFEAQGAPGWLFTDNETNARRLFNAPNPSAFLKDAFHDCLIGGRFDAAGSDAGTKAATHYQFLLPPGGTAVIRCRLFDTREPGAFDEIFARRLAEAGEFYDSVIPAALSAEERGIMRQAYAGLLWTRQFYYYAVGEWLDGDPALPPPEIRKRGRNHEWRHLFNRDVLSMPDKWEYPWYAAWDLAFHMLPYASIDPDFAKDQLVLLLREWYMHPNGQIPAYEFNFSDVNPPVHAWAAWRVYKISAERGKRDRRFLERVFHKLLLNFTWWVNRKDPTGNNLFTGGFLGLDNIGAFDRSKPLPSGGHLNQADGTAWMAFYCSTMLSIALELACEDSVYEDLASKFFEHFVAIADAMNTLGGTGLWDETDGFYYDEIRLDDRVIPLRLRSMVGIIPLFAVEVLEQESLDALPGFTKRMLWFLEHRKDLAAQIAYMTSRTENGHVHRLLAIPSRERLTRVLRYLLDENEFLSPYGIRSLSRVYRDTPYVFQVNGQEYRVAYVPAEADSGLFGGNSNWRGPVWFPLNYLLIEALERYHHFYSDSLKVECPTGSGRWVNLRQVACDLEARLRRIYTPDEHGQAPWQGGEVRWPGLTLFHEYFDGDTGRGLGASHHTGWTALITRLLLDAARDRDLERR